MRRLTSLWYWRYRLELVMGRFGWVPLSEYRKLQASYMKVCAENWNRQQEDQRWAERQVAFFESPSYRLLESMRQESRERGTPCS